MMFIDTCTGKTVSLIEFYREWKEMSNGPFCGLLEGEQESFLIYACNCIEATLLERNDSEIVGLTRKESLNIFKRLYQKTGEV